MRPFFRILLWPVSMLYGIGVRFRNHLYNIGYKKSFAFDCLVISVGNLSVGGNGKTPMVEYLVRFASSSRNLAVLSRGYGRNSKGFRFVTDQSTSQQVGDEPLQMYRKFHPKLVVAVGESRALAIPNILFEQPEVNTIILDDAFQHRSVRPHFSIVVTDYWAPFYDDYLLPAGRLREPRKGVSRADVVVVTKCPANMSSQQKAAMMERVGQFSKKVQVYFTAIKYSQARHFFTEEPLKDFPDVLLVSGIAKSNTLVQYVSEKFRLSGHLEYNDHHEYIEKDIGNVKKYYHSIKSTNKIILTTEKDMVRLLKYKEALKDLPLYYLPIECVFLENGNKFDQAILNSIESY